MVSRDTSADAAAALETDLRNARLPAPRTLSGFQVAILLEAFAEADAALRMAESSKVGFISRPAKSARTAVTRAWATLKEPAQ